MLKKTLSIPAPLALLLTMLTMLTMSAPLTSDAAAYRDVCLQIKFGAWYSGRFRVEYGNPRVLRDADFINERVSGYPLDVDTWESLGYLAYVDGRVGWSSKILAAGRSCLSMEDVPDGKSFAVLLLGDGGWGTLGYFRYCRDWGGREPLIFRHYASDRRRLWVDAWGSVWNLECRAVWAR